jgi:hypothetical protein
VLRILNVYPVSDFSIPYPGLTNPGSRIRIRIKEFKNFNPKTDKFSKIRYGVFIPDLDFFPSRIQGAKKHRIPDPLPVTAK